MAILTKSTAVTRVVYLGGGLGGIWTLKISKNGAAFVSPTSNIVTSLTNGFYSFSLSTSDTNTVGDLAYLFTGGTGTPVFTQPDQVYTSPLATLPNDGTTTLNLTQLNLVNAGGPALIASGTDHGAKFIASSGPGLYATGTTQGLLATATASNGTGAYFGGVGWGCQMICSNSLPSAVPAESQDPATPFLSTISPLTVPINGMGLSVNGPVGATIQGTAGYGLNCVGTNTGAQVSGGTLGLSVFAGGGTAAYVQGSTIGANIVGVANQGVVVAGNTDAVNLASTTAGALTLSGNTLGMSVASSAGHAVTISGNNAGVVVSGENDNAVNISSPNSGINVATSGRGVQIVSQSGNGIDVHSLGGDAIHLQSTLYGIECQGNVQGVRIIGGVDAVDLVPGSGVAVNYAGTEMIAKIVTQMFTTGNTVETGYDLQDALSLMLSAMCGKSTLAGNVRTFRDVNDTVNRIVATIDIAGQRLNVTLTPA